MLERQGATSHRGSRINRWSDPMHVRSPESFASNDRAAKSRRVVAIAGGLPPTQSLPTTWRRRWLRREIRFSPSDRPLCTVRAIRLGSGLPAIRWMKREFTAANGSLSYHTIDNFLPPVSAERRAGKPPPEPFCGLPCGRGTPGAILPRHVTCVLHQRRIVRARKP